MRRQYHLLSVLLFGLAVLTACSTDGLRDRDHELNPDFPKKLAGKNITLQTDRGTAFTVYEVGSKNAQRGIVLYHEWWGLNDHIRAWADRFAGLGYYALAVDLYNDQVATTPEEARSFVAAFDQEAANTRHRAALKALKAPGRKLAVIGWCFGGGQSLRATLTDPDAVSATVVYYGPLITDVEMLKKLKAPVLGIFGSKDTSVTPEKVKAFEDAMKQAGRKLEAHTFEAEHAFANPSGTRYHGAAAQAAWKITQEFLDRNLR